MKYFVFGATGSIGLQTLDVIERLNGTLVGFSFYTNMDKALEINSKFNPSYIISLNKISLDGIKTYQNKDIDHILESLDKDTIIVNAISGIAGLSISYKILVNGFDLYLANKESLVLAGDMLIKTAKINNLRIIPIDSEHNSLLKLLLKQNYNEISKLYITASGGALRNKITNLDKIKKEDILKHPNWNMGNIITVNSSTMVNKAYEIIEVHHLFNIDYNKIGVVQHDESLVHAFVEYNDGSISASFGINDMRNAINYALNYPNYKDINLNRLSLTKLNTLHFNELNLEVYPSFTFILETLKLGGIYPTIVNSVNEFLVNEFLNNRITFKELNNLLVNYINKGIEIYKSSIYNKKNSYITDILEFNEYLTKILLEDFKEEK